MSDFETKRQALLKATFSLWVNWSFPTVALAVVMLLGPFISKVLLPVVMYVLAIIIMYIIRKARKTKSTSCYKVPYVVMIQLFWAANFFVLANLAESLNFGTDFNGQPYNPNMPWIPILILAPLGVAVTRYFMSSKCSHAFCRDCEARFGQSVERGYLSQLFKREANYQIRIMYYIRLGVAIVVWLYYFLVYKNISFNFSDKYFFVYVPVTVFILSMIYLGIRYHGMYIYYLTGDGRSEESGTGRTTVRFLVVSEDTLWLRVPDISGLGNQPDVPKIDTPLVQSMSYRANFNKLEADDLFKGITGIRGGKVRFLYRSADNSSFSNVFHYAVFLKNPEEVEKSAVKADWLNFAKIQLLYQAGLISTMLQAELYRIHTIVMAWKTYTKEGKRLYEIKHYRPTFRLSDMKDWDVDYNDPVWLFVAMNNEDNRFFRLRKFWRKYFTGTGYLG